ncbi:peptide chain release factor N(5)-glutamine methyltransferase [Sediminibacterium soli]|uniref:peptide chain release factor N(5)-glutamine methyltransferase n=1 Tax=Sediminibacterium soli TaxID=2698829 RepID=UPI001379A1F6|nr:peptide chain release factor N(5)-glutamine methyltransferase [Sediminibacterium soli]NCI47138.1 peptide chain release factor N(5)-glutamine methyltransferase [Sediminibacterium soli]
MTLRSAQQALVTQLEALYDAREAANIADWVLEHITGKKKIDRLLVRDEPIGPDRELELQKISAALALNKPVQYVLHEAWFDGMPFYVDENVLIPRPETEELVHWVAETACDNASPTILDIGTGSGCIPVSLAKRLPGAAITGIDISSGALSVAKRNALTQKTAVTFLQLDFLGEKDWQQLPVYNTIVSNPPYIRQTESASMHPNVLEHEPHIALFVPDDDPLLFYRKIAAFAKAHLADGGNIFLEINEALGADTVAIFSAAGYQTELRKDMQGKERMLRVSFTGL